MIDHERVKVLSGKNYVRIDSDNVQEICGILMQAVHEKEYIVVDIIAALAVLAVEISLKGGLSKPSLLGYVSNFWEQKENSLN